MPQTQADKGSARLKIKHARSQDNAFLSVSFRVEYPGTTGGC
jgi:hypothetical protein